MLTDKPASTQEYNTLLGKLSPRGEYAVDAPRTSISFFLSQQAGVCYLMVLTGFERVTHDVYGPVVECIGRFDNTRDKVSQRIRLGVSRTSRRLCHIRRD